PSLERCAIGSSQRLATPPFPVLWWRTVPLCPSVPYPCGPGHVCALTRSQGTAFSPPPACPPWARSTKARTRPVALWHVASWFRHKPMAYTETTWNLSPGGTTGLLGPITSSCGVTRTALMSTLRRLQPFAVLALLAGLTAPCLAPSLGFGHVHAATVAASGGILRISDEGESDLASIDPPSPNASDAQSNVVEKLVFGGLVRLDQNLRVQPDAAASWTVSHDGKVYTFTLQPGLKWGDGTPLTAQDVVWSFNRAFSPAYASGGVSFYLAHILGGLDVVNKKAKTVKGIKAIGTNKVQITLDQPAAVI